MITYTLFSGQEVFADPRLNVFFNQFYTLVANKFGLEEASTKLLLDGKVALLLQEEDPGVKHTKIKLTTPDIAVYSFIKNSLSSLDFAAFSIQNDYIIFKLKSDFLVYFHLDQTATNYVVAKAINVRLKTDIK